MNSLSNEETFSEDLCIGCGHSHDLSKNTLGQDEWAVIFMGGKLDISPELENLVNRSKFIIAADAGMNHAYKMNILPSLFVGDMDSVDNVAYEWAKKHQVIEEKFPERKNATDGELALDRVIAEGYTNLLILGSSMVDRPDHCFAVLTYCLQMKKQFHVRSLISDGQDFFMPQSGGERFEVDFSLYYKKIDYPNIIISLLPFSNVEGLTLNGLSYLVEDFHLPFSSSRGVSNSLEINQHIAKVQYISGDFLFYFSLSDS